MVEEKLIWAEKLKLKEYLIIFVKGDNVPHDSIDKMLFN